MGEERTGPMWYRICTRSEDPSYLFEPPSSPSPEMRRRRCVSSRWHWAWPQNSNKTEETTTSTEKTRRLILDSSTLSRERPRQGCRPRRRLLKGPRHPCLLHRGDTSAMHGEGERERERWAGKSSWIQLLCGVYSVRCTSPKWG